VLSWSRRECCWSSCRGGCQAAGSKPVRLTRALVRADGTFRLATRFAHTRRKKMLVALPGGEGNVRGYVGYVKVRVI
jgi:hypothetical protein